MHNKVINARLRFRKPLLRRELYPYRIPERMLMTHYPKQRLTIELAEKLIEENQLASWTNENYEEFLLFFFENDPERLRRLDPRAFEILSAMHEERQSK
jgi:hypothetical protein